MSDLLYLIRQLRDTEGELGRLQKALAQSPDDDAIELNILGLQKRQRSLRSQFDAETNVKMIDVCEYRLLPEIAGEYPISGISSALASFQELIAILFTAIRSKLPRQRASVPADMVALSTLNFSYSYQGSVGVVLTVPNERLLFIESDLDLAVTHAFKLAKVESTDEIAELARIVGVAPIRKAYNWATAHARHGMTAEIKWMRGGEIRNRTLAHTEEMGRVAELIKATSEQTNDPMTLSGLLTGLNVTARTFQLEPPDAEIIRGRFAKEFSVDPAILVPSFQSARLIKHTVIQYAVEDDQVTWELNGFEKRISE
jgi:hypothetical protein